MPTKLTVSIGGGGEGTGYVSYPRCSVGVPGLAARISGGCVEACVACFDCMVV